MRRSVGEVFALRVSGATRLSPTYLSKRFITLFPQEFNLPNSSALDWYKSTVEMIRLEEQQHEGPSFSGAAGLASAAVAPAGSRPRFTVSPELWASLHQYIEKLPANGSISEEISKGLWSAYARTENNEERLAFISNLAKLTPKKENLCQLAEELRKCLEAPSGEGGSGAATFTVKQLKQLESTRSALTPFYTRWLEESQTLAGGMKLLLELRASLLRLERWTLSEKKSSDDRAAVAAVLGSLTSLLRSWFQIAWLATARLSWDRTPPSVIENVLRHEQVHPFPSLSAAKWRMSPTKNREMFAFYHPTIPHEPLVTVQVALTKGIAASVDDILWRERKPANNNSTTAENLDVAPDTAIFYSINATQEGLQGIELGKYLIQKVVAELQRRPLAATKQSSGETSSTATPTTSSNGTGIHTFSTLSPIPQFVPWLQSLLVTMKKGSKDDLCERAFDPSYRVADVKALCAELCPSQPPDPLAAITALVAFAQQPYEEKAWARLQALEGPLTRLAGRYLTKEKRRGAVYDPVGNFHLKNGALLYRVNWTANKTKMGMQQSLGMMVNYLYDLDRTSSNAFAYELSGEVATGAPLEGLFDERREK